MNPFATLLRLIDRDGAGAMVTVVDARGSTPRDAGARMVVSSDGAISGTIGGGRLESEAIATAVRMTSEDEAGWELRRFPLGPALGQCCGGHVTLLIETASAAERDAVAALAEAVAAGPVRTNALLVAGTAPERRIVEGDERPAAITAHIDESGVLAETFGRTARPLFLFGAGHVGRALILALAPLPFDITWVDERADMFPGAMPSNVQAVATGTPDTVAAAIPEGAFVLVMTHDHDTDLRILHAALATGRAAYAGLIGSATKRARFERRLVALGLDEATATGFRCPIGVPGIRSKEPASIAAAVAADLLVAMEAIEGARSKSTPLIAAVNRAGSGRPRR